MLDRTNPYQTPASSLEREPDPGLDQELYAGALFSVGTFKLALLSVGSFGLYQLYWFYQNWRRTRDHERSTLSPVLRSVFGVPYSYSLFRRISERAEEAGVPVRWAPSTLFLLYVALSLAANLPGFWWLAFQGSFVPLARVQETAARLNVQNGLPAHPWERISPLHWVAVAPGFALLALLALVALGVVA